MDFAVDHGFQILGALVFLLIGLKVSGVVQDITLAATQLVGEDWEVITIPNKEIVGQVIVNSQEKRIVETRIAIGYEKDTDKAIVTLRYAVTAIPGLAGEPAPQIGVHDFTYGGVIIGLRFWVPTSNYFHQRYRIKGALLAALRQASIALMPAAGVSVAAPALTADHEDNAPPPPVATS